MSERGSGRDAPGFPRASKRRGEKNKRARLESEDEPSEAHDQRTSAEICSLFAPHNRRVLLLYLLVVEVTVRRSGAALVRFVNWVLRLNVFGHVTFAGEERRCVVRRLPQPDLDALAGRGEQVAQDLEGRPESASQSMMTSPPHPNPLPVFFAAQGKRTRNV